MNEKVIIIISEPPEGLPLAFEQSHLGPLKRQEKTSASALLFAIMKDD